MNKNKWQRVYDTINECDIRLYEIWDDDGNETIIDLIDEALSIAANKIKDWSV